MSTCFELEPIVASGSAVPLAAFSLVAALPEHTENVWVESLSQSANAPWILLARCSSGTALLPFSFNVTRPLAEQLREETGLPIDILASLVHVSRQRFHQWLRGEGVSAEKEQRMTALLHTLRTVKSLRSNLKLFLSTPTAIGLPMDLLTHGEDLTVVGLAHFAQPERQTQSDLVHFAEIPRRTIDGRSPSYDHYNAAATVDRLKEAEEEMDVIPIGSVILES